MKYYQTWMYVSRMNKIPFIGKYIVKIIQYVCGKTTKELRNLCRIIEADLEARNDEIK